MGGKYLKRAAVRTGKRALKSILKFTAPIWGPLVLLLFLGLTAYTILFEIPKEALADNTTNALTKVEAFLGITEDPKATKNARLLDEYKEISDTWDTGLTDEQKKQVQAYKFPYSVLMAVDRVVNDEAVWEGKQYVNPQPQKVFDVLKPKFTWKDSTITTVTVTTDDNGNSHATTTTEKISLVTQADTFEGSFKYQYEWKTTTSGDTTVTREVVKQITPPAVYYVPLKEYLSDSRGIKDKDTFELIENLAITYDPEYQFNLGTQDGQEFATSPAYALAYADAVTQITQNSNVPQALMLATIAHESGGNWKAVNKNTNGTTDAGLCQINSVNWPAYGLSDDPFNVNKNAGAGISILGNALSRYNDIMDALYAYNGGTPENGKMYNPSYAPSVMALFTQLQSYQTYAAVVSSRSGQPLTILAAEQNGATWQAYGQSGKNFINPLEITIINERTGEQEKVSHSSGDGTMWSAQAWVYHPSLKNAKNGDTLKIEFPDGKSTEVQMKSTADFEKMINFAESYLGLPYVFGGNSPVTGFDCSSYVQYVFAHSGIQLPRVTEDQFRVGQPVAKADLEPGDLVFFTTYEPGASHVGIYIGDRRMIDAQNNGVSYDNIDSPYWASRYYGARRVPLP